MAYNFLTMSMTFPRLAVASEKIAIWTFYREAQFTRWLYADPPRIMPPFTRDVIIDLGVSTMKNNFIFGLTEDTLSHLITGGIPQNFLNYIDKVVFRPWPKEDSGFQPYNVGDLEFCFVIFLECLGVATFAFLMELSWFYAKQFSGLMAIFMFLYRKNY